MLGIINNLIELMIHHVRNVEYETMTNWVGLISK